MSSSVQSSPSSSFYLSDSSTPTISNDRDLIEYLLFCLSKSSVSYDKNLIKNYFLETKNNLEAKMKDYELMINQYSCNPYFCDVASPSSSSTTAKATTNNNGVDTTSFFSSSSSSYTDTASSDTTSCNNSYNYSNKDEVDYLSQLIDPSFTLPSPYRSNSSISSSSSTPAIVERTNEEFVDSLYNLKFFYNYIEKDNEDNMKEVKDKIKKYEKKNKLYKKTSSISSLIAAMEIESPSHSNSNSNSNSFSISSDSINNQSLNGSILPPIPPIEENISSSSSTTTTSSYITSLFPAVGTEDNNENNNNKDENEKKD